ncbi:hypothetical protein [Plasticicumulans sp.]|uniref:hypothetical protein n=1 Tax=Plasticicumulans sp. TaxID=2307179 RepID=UPI001D61C5EC|nr:hypothetical protein [Nitrospira sp.]
MFRVRLTFGSKAPRTFVFEEPSAEFSLLPERVVTLHARNADKLVDATSFHFESGEFETQADAKEFGERLRLRLQLANAMLDLGLHVPDSESSRQSWAEEVKEKLLREHDAVLMDSVNGVTVFADDGRHFEAVMSGIMHNQPSDPSYIFSALTNLWPVDVQLDEPSVDALRMLGLATVEQSPKTAFLTAYLALEPLVPRSRRSKSALELLERFEAQVDKASGRKASPLTKSEATSLKGAITALREESFSSAITRLATRPGFPSTIQGEQSRKFISKCISVRNKIAHKAKLPADIDLNQLTAGVSHLVLTLIWSRIRLPTVTLHRPPSKIFVPEGGIKIRHL